MLTPAVFWIINNDYDSIFIEPGRWLSQDYDYSNLIFHYEKSRDLLLMWVMEPPVM